MSLGGGLSLSEGGVPARAPKDRPRRVGCVGRLASCARARHTPLHASRALYRLVLIGVGWRVSVCRRHAASSQARTSAGQRDAHGRSERERQPWNGGDDAGRARPESNEHTHIRHRLIRSNRCDPISVNRWALPSFVTASAVKVAARSALQGAPAPEAGRCPRTAGMGSWYG